MPFGSRLHNVQGACGRLVRCERIFKALALDSRAPLPLMFTNVTLHFSPRRCVKFLGPHIPMMQRDKIWYDVAIKL